MGTVHSEQLLVTHHGKDLCRIYVSGHGPRRSSRCRPRGSWRPFALRPRHPHHAPAIVGTQVHEHVVPGPTYHTTHQEVVGHRTVQVGSQAVQVGHTHTQEQSVHQAAPYTYQAGPPKTSQSTVPIAPPAIPAAPAPYAAIPPAPTNQGPAPADTVTVQRIAPPVRTHTKITPQVRRIEPELQVNKYTVEVPVPVPTPVEREVIVDRHVAKPYTVEVPQPYAVPKPYKVHPVHHVVETPVIDKHTVSVHQPAVRVAAPVAVAHAAPVAVAHAAPVATLKHAAPVAVAHAAPFATLNHAAPLAFHHAAPIATIAKQD